MSFISKEEFNKVLKKFPIYDYQIKVSTKKDLITAFKHADFKNGTTIFLILKNKSIVQYNLKPYSSYYNIDINIEKQLKKTLTAIRKIEEVDLLGGNGNLKYSDVFFKIKRRNK